MADDELELEIELRAPDQVARRLVILASLARWATAAVDEDAEEAIAAAEILDLRDALRFGDFASDLAPSELALFDQPDLSEAAILGLSWQIEAAAALAWAAGLEIDLTQPWRVADTNGVIARVPDPWDDLDAFLGSIALLSEDEIAFERERSELWFWRAQVAADWASTAPQDRRELEVTIAETASEAEEAGLLFARGGDFEVDRRPFRQLNEETVALIAEVSSQRLHALNWLCGYGETWDDVPFDI